MSAGDGTIGRHGIEAHGLTPRGDVLWDLSPAHLVEHAVRNGEGLLVSSGAFATTTGQHTGRSPNDRFVVREPGSESDVWWGDVNLPMEESCFDALRARVVAELERGDVYARDAFCGADPAYRIGVRVITKQAWHNLFAHNMFLRPTAAQLEGFQPDWTVLHAPEALADPETCGTNSSTFVVLHPGRREVIIGGTAYAGEIKKSIFSVMNFRLPAHGVLPMHCSANIGEAGDTALFFGLSGTGKTTLSADEHRLLIGDDEHGWGHDGVFNFEGGCYAKTIRITEESEPGIYRATSRFGTIIENVVLDPVTREPDFNDGSLTENTRSSYPIEHLGKVAPGSRGGHPRNIFFLTADAFGVLPPISSLTPEQAMFHFLSGYTAKVAGTERGVKEPTATFSACFGSPFLPRHPGVYADMLGRLMREHDARVWLINTGWTGGGYGEGERISLAYTRGMLHAALDGALDDAPTSPHPVFGVHVPRAVEGVPDELLDPRATWADPADYDRKAAELARMFQDNFSRYADGVDDAVRAAGPRVG